MFQLNVLINTSTLPTDVMSLRDDKFIEFVRNEAGDAAAELLEIQGINSVRSLLMTPNVYSIMDVNSKYLENFKRKYGYIQDDNTFVLKSGVKGNVDYLIDLLQQKCVDDAKSMTFPKRNKSLSSSDIITNTSSTTTNSTLPIPSINSSSNASMKPTNLSITEHKAYVIEAINKWCTNNKSIFDLLEFSLLEGVHYAISIVNGPGNTLIGNIKCCCEKWMSLSINRGKFQLSNFYRHLHGTRSGMKCRNIEEMMKNHQSILPFTDSQESLVRPGTSSHQTSLPPPPPSLMPSSSAISTITSDPTISASSTNSTATNDDNRIINSSSSATKLNKRKTSMIESSYSTRQSAKRTRRE